MFWLISKTLRNQKEKNRIKISVALKKFKRAKGLEGLRERTKDDHDVHLRYFMDFCKLKKKEITYLDEVTIPLCRDYVDYMKNKKRKWDNHEHINNNKKRLANNTINIRLRSLRAQFNFYVGDGYIDKNLWNSIKNVKFDKDTVPALTETHLKKLFEVPDKNTFIGFRNYVIMNILLDTGLRINELLSLSKSNADFKKGIIHIKAKVAKSREARSVPISEDAMKLLKELLKENKKLKKKRARKIFLGVSGKQLSDSYVRRFLREYRRKAKIEDVKVSPHVFRHSFSKFYILSGGDPFTLQRILGHKSLEKVRLYIQMNQDDLKNQHNNYSPLNFINKKITNKGQYTYENIKGIA